MSAMAGAGFTVPGVMECAILCAAAVLLLRDRGASPPDARATRALEVAFLLFGSRLAFASLTNNSPLGLFGFVGLSAGLAAAAAVAAAQASRARALLFGLPLIVLTVSGLRVSASREVHDFWWDARFDDVQVSQEMWPARWGGGERGRAPRVRDFDAVVARLRREKEPFFVFPDTTVMYGLVGLPSAQPLVWFHKGVSYSSVPDPALDARVVQALVASSVKTIVLEDVSFLGTERRLKDFPGLRRFIDENFVPEETFGIFQILKRRPLR
jgi:hypothetical protein